VFFITTLIDRIEKRGVPIRHLIKFGLIGTSGIFVNMGLFFFFNQIGLYYTISSIIAIEVSIISNFFLNYFWTWRDKKDSNRFYIRFFRFYLIALLAGIINYSVLVFLVSSLEFNKYLSNLIGIGFGFIINFSLNHFWNFR